MDRETNSNIEKEILWVTSELYDIKREECKAVRKKDSFHLERTKKHQYRRQSEPVVSQIAEVVSPKLIHHSKFTLYSGSNEELKGISNSYKGNMNQTLVHTKSAGNSPQVGRCYTHSEECFIVNLYIETKISHLGPFPFEIYPKMNVGLLKLKVEKELAIPTSFQKWILNKTLAIDSDLLLLNCDVVPGSPIFLYLDSNFEESIDLEKLYSLGKISEDKITHRQVDCYKPYTIKTNDLKNNILSENKSDAYMIKNLPKGEGHKFCPGNFQEHDKRIKKLPESLFKNCSRKSMKIKSEKQFSSEGDIGPPYPKYSPCSNKGPFKPVFAKVKEKECYTLLSNIIAKDERCSTETTAIDDSSTLNTNNTSRKFKITDSLVTKNLFNTDKHKKAERMHIVKNDIRPIEDETNVMNQKSAEPKKQDAQDLVESVPSASQDSKITILSTKCGHNSILEKVRMRHKTKIRKDENSCTAEDTKYISNLISDDKIFQKSAQNVIDNASQSEILMQSNHQLKCSSTSLNSSENFQLQPETNKVVSNQKDDSVMHDHKEEPRADFAGISTKELKMENLADSLDIQSIENHCSDVSESEITEICIVNNDDESCPQMQSEHSSSSRNIDLSNSCSIGQDVAERENEQIVKKCPENYEHLLKMEDLNLVKNIVNFTCPVCFEDFESDQGVVLHECLHIFCIDCLARTIDYAEEVLIKCPYRDDEYSCQSHLQQREIKALVSPETYERYLQRSIITAESLAEKSFHCKTPDCPGWCMFDDNIIVFHCPVCFHYNCLNCGTIHEGLNCRQYQDKLQSQKKLDPDSEKTLEFLNKMIEDGKALRCPKCDLILMKKWGCDWLKCAICLTEICWITKGPRWGPGGQGDTSGGCRCGVNGIKCHPSCTYCH